MKTAFATEPVYFCGYYLDPDATYYNLFNQESISQKAFYPFLRTDDIAFYADIQPVDSENIELWHTYFDKKYTKKELTAIIYNDGKKDYLSRLKKGVKETKATTYLLFAKECEAVAIDKIFSWDYDEILKSKVNNTPQFLEKGLKLFEESTDEKLKIRYAYQIIRLYHYGKQHTEAIAFFENQITPLRIKDEIYYYALDQLAGCYYNTKEYEKAAYTFLTVFDKSYDRKQSAFTSYKFCTYRGAEGKTLLKTSEEKATQVFISGLRDFSDSFQDLEKIASLNAAEEKQELLIMRIINNLERSILNHYSQENKQSLFIVSEKSRRSLNRLLDFVTQKLNNSPKNTAFWQLTDSYLSFLGGNTAMAKTKLAIINSVKLKKQKEQLAIVYKVFSWDEITEENENWLATVFLENKNIQVVDYCGYKPFDKNGQPCSLHSFVFKQLSHYYFKKNKLAKAFLLHNYMDNINGISSHILVDDLIKLVEKPIKNSFEKLLLKEQTDRVYNVATIVGSLKRAKGDIYYRNGEFTKALPYFTNSKGKAFIPANVFSNNTKECFSCNSSTIMEDEVYKVKEFSFLQKTMNKEEVLRNLQTLENLTNNNEEKPWKRKIANYLLGNYFFNVSNTGYYRTLTYPGYSYAYNYSFGTNQPTMDAFIREKEAYYFTPIYNSYNALANKAQEYYKTTIALSSDDELNARCSYMIAKCELNDYYNNGWKYEYSSYDGSEFNNFINKGFEALKTDYSHTNFYTEIKTKCSFFRYYDGY